MTQRGTQATGLDVMIGRCFPDSQHGRTGRQPANVGCSFFRYSNDELRNHNNHRRKHKTWTREDNQLALHSYFKSNPTQEGYRKRMIKIWQECGNFQTSQRLADKVSTLVKEAWFSDLEILEIHQKINNEQDSHTVPDESGINKEKQPNRNGLEEGPKAEIHIDLLKTSLMEYIGSGSRNSPQFRLALEMIRWRQGAHVPEWMTKGKTTLIQKDTSKGTVPNNYRPITCLSNDVENINSTNKGRDLLLANKPQIVSWGTERMPQRIQRQSRVTLHRSAHPKWVQDQTENLAIDYKKAYDMVPQSWIISCLKMYKISGEVIKFIEKTMKTWKVEFTAGERSLAEAKIPRGIFQGDSLSPLLFIFCDDAT